MPGPSRRRSNAEWSAETRGALLRAATTAFARSGYGQVSLADVARRASVTKGAIYHHFSDKHALFREVLLDVQRHLVSEIDRRASVAASPLAGVRLGCEAFLERAPSPDAARILLLDGPRVLGWAAWRTIDAEIGGRSLRAGLEAATVAGEIRPVDLDAMTTLISGALNEAALAIVDANRQPRVRRAMVSAVNLLLDGLRRDASVRRARRTDDVSGSGRHAAAT